MVGDSAVGVIFFVCVLALVALVLVVVVVVAAAAAAAAEVFWRFAGGGATLVEAGGGARETGGANASAGSIAKMPGLVLLLVGVLGDASSLPRMVRGGSDDGGVAPNDGTKGATAAGGTRKGSTGKPERRDSKLLPPLVLPALGHENMYGLNRPAICCWAAASKAGLARTLLKPARGLWMASVLPVLVRRPKPGWLVEADGDGSDDKALRSALGSREIPELDFLCLLRDAVSRSAEKKVSSGGNPILAHKSSAESISVAPTRSIVSLVVFE